MTEQQIKDEAIARINPQTLEKLGKIAADIWAALNESFECAKEAILNLIQPICDAAKEFAAVIADIIAEDVELRTIPPRSITRRIGCRPFTGNRKPQIIRTGCRSK